MQEVRFDYTTDDGTDGQLVYVVPDNTILSEYDTEADAEAASIEAGTYPPRFETE